MRLKVPDIKFGETTDGLFLTSTLAAALFTVKKLRLQSSTFKIPLPVTLQAVFISQ